MPMTPKGRKIKAAMKKTYGPKKGERVFHASKNKGTIRGIDKRSRPNATNKRNSNTKRRSC